MRIQAVLCWSLAALILLAVTGCKSVMTPMAGAYVHKTRPTPGSLDVTLSGALGVNDRDTHVFEPENMHAGPTLRIEPMLSKTWSMPLEIQTVHPVVKEASFDLVTRIGGRFIGSCRELGESLCSDEQNASKDTFVMGFGLGPNVRFIESSEGQFTTAYGFNIDYEGGFVREVTELVSFNMLGRAGFLYNPEAPNLFTSLVNFGIGFHLSSANVLSLGARIGAGLTFNTRESDDPLVIGGLFHYGVSLDWSFRFGGSVSPH